MFKAYKNLSPNARLSVGVGVLIWGTAGLYLSDRAEERFGFKPTEQDKEELRQMTPHIVAVEREEK
ncbi:hypothetical protein ACQRIT_003539 [Beauveria bassiana]